MRHMQAESRETAYKEKERRKLKYMYVKGNTSHTLHSLHSY